MAQSPSVRRVDASDFDWSAGSGPAADLRAIVAAATRVDRTEPLNEAALLSLRHEGLDGSALFTAGTAGFAWVHGPSSEREADLVVTPEARDLGVGTALASAVLEAFPDGPMSAWSHGNHPAAAALAERFGWERVRDLWVMRRPLPDDLPPPEDVPGIVVRAFRPGEDEDAFLALNAEAFADHPEQGRMTRADLEKRMAEPWFDPAGFFLAEARSEGRVDLLGFHWTKVPDADPPHGEVYVVGVSPRAQGSGLGRLLTVAGLHHLAARGLPEVLLYVEADNAPAIAVYSRLGFTHDETDTHAMYRRP